jgi:para-nitrobenzyl esterase
MQQWLCSLLCLAAAVVATPIVAAIPQPVHTASGPVSGVPATDGTVLAFKGVPFAAPPIGDLRWRAPTPPASWTRVRSADQFSASCIQNMQDERKPWTHEFRAHNTVSEDCLYLNVWTPARTASDKLPVYFWIYGGGFVAGSSAVPVYDGENLARRGVVVVTINYRVGVLGFLAHPELTREAGWSGNYGSLDQVAALQWVQKNIALFGGDPRNVTISGQSAGANSVHNLVASPLAKGLFQRAIAESGSSYALATPPTPMLAAAEAVGLKFAAAKGAGSLRELRAMSPDALMAKLSDGSAPAFRPVIDRHFLTADPKEIYAEGKQNDVPELTGMNMDEKSAAADYGVIPMAAFETSVREHYSDLASRYFQLYPNSTQAQSGDSQKTAYRDAGRVSMYLWAEQRAKTATSKAFTYYWTHSEPGPDSARFGAFHSSEVPYVFNTLNQSSRPWTDQDRKLAELMGSYWLNFMKNGDPNGKDLPAWPAFSSKSAVTMELGDRSGPRPIAEEDKLAFWAKYVMRPNAVLQ